LAAQLRIADSVHFLGSIAHGELPKYWAASDVFVLPSRFDAWPVAILEAAAAGLPIIGSDSCGSMIDLMSEKSGWIFPSGSIQKLARAMEEAVRMSENLKVMGTAASAAIAHQSPEAVAETFVRIAQRVHREK
jgi:glycosyltransferase involved in cell wall biosynthesis